MKHSGSATPGPAMRSVVVLALTLLAAGCGWLDRQPDAPAPTPAPAGAPEPESATAREALPSLAAVLAQIEGGNFSRAERMLARLGEHDAPPIGTAMLREQLREAPERLLPGPYREVVVEPGETLSEIAGRELGNPLLFIALARLNQIEVPRRVAVGTLLRVPDRSPAVPGGAETPAVETADPADDVLTVSDYLFSSGQEQSALRLLRGALAEKPDSARLQRRLVEASLEAADRFEAQGRPELARTELEAAVECIGEPALRDRLADALDRLRLERQLQAAAQAERDGDLEGALALARQAAGAAPASSRADAQLRRLEERFVETTHESALLAWRERNVDLAIRRWQRLLEWVPDFEPAAVYLERALELRRRLEQ